eukprot:2511358-Rhodomonas_salina.1
MSCIRGKSSAAKDILARVNAHVVCVYVCVRGCLCLCLSVSLSLSLSLSLHELHPRQEQRHQGYPRSGQLAVCVSVRLSVA